MKTEFEKMNEYVETCWNKLYEYHKGIQDGNIVVNVFIKNVVGWFRETDEWEIKVKKIDRFFRFLYLINISYDDLGYRRIDLLPWQAYLTGMIFGMYHRGTNQRRFSESFTFIGRGNGKSTLGVAIAIYFLLGYDKHSPEAVIISTVENRKKIIKDLHKTIMHSPELHQYVHFNNGAVMLNSFDANIKGGDREIRRVNDVGTIQVVPNDDKKLDGLELVLAFIDEIHLLNDEQVFRNAQKSAGKRKDSLVMLISTAGFSSTGFCVELVDRAKKVAMGEIKDDKFLPFLYCLDKDDDPEDLSNRNIWHKCNPSLGHTKTLKKMEDYYNDSLYSPKAKMDFKTKDLNIFVDYNEYEVLTAEERLKAYKPVDLEKWRGKDCYLGLDLSKINDLSSLVCLFHDDGDDKWEAYPYYWISNDSKLTIRKTGENIKGWIDRGCIKVCPEKKIDYSMIADKIKELTTMFTVKGIGYDPWGWEEMEKYLIDVDCGARYEVKQYYTFMSTELSKILTSILSERLIFSDNPVMLWNWKNARIKQDPNGNLKIYKNESKESVDGAVALNDAMSLYYYLNFNSSRQDF